MRTRDGLTAGVAVWISHAGYCLSLMPVQAEGRDGDAELRTPTQGTAATHNSHGPPTDSGLGGALVLQCHAASRAALRRDADSARSAMSELKKSAQCRVCWASLAGATARVQHAA